MAENIASIQVLSNLGNLLEAGVSETHALAIALRAADPSVEHRFTSELIAERVSQLSSGSSLAAELEELGIFSEYELAILKASAAGGDITFAIHAIVDEYVLFRSLNA